MSWMLPPTRLGTVAALIAFGSAAVLAQQRDRQPQPRPAAARPADLRVPDVSPELERILADWSRASAGIEKLRGKHERIVYDHVFQVEKYAEGDFYYESPDRGRIDLRPNKDVKPGDPGQRRDKDGHRYTVQPDVEERWICDGQQIFKVNDNTREAEVFPIPEDARGQNIMDGPLPFLFGLPPEKAKRRFEFKIVENDKLTSNTLQLAIRPRLKQDAENWKWAEVMLDKDNHYLPDAVRLVDPSGNEETIYVFKDLETGDRKRLFPLTWIRKNEDPFKPDLKGFDVKVIQPQPQHSPLEPGTLPSVVGLHGTRALAVLQHVGCEIEWVPGEQAARPEITHVVYEQSPAPRTKIAEGQKVTLKFYVAAPVETPPAGDSAGPAAPRRDGATERPDAADATPEQKTAGAASVPSVLGLSWTRAEAQLKAAGYLVKPLRGKLPPRPELLWAVYEQQPKSGATLARGQVIYVTLYDDPAKSGQK